MITTKISEKDLTKIRQDLQFIDLITKAGKEMKCRVIISGGYAVDGHLGKITRPHNDIDVQVFCLQRDPNEVVKKLMEKVAMLDSNFERIQVEDKQRGEFYHTFSLKNRNFGADLYIIHLATDPFSSEKVVIKKDGDRTEKQQFETKMVSIEGVTFEAQGALVELVDKIYKKQRGDKPNPKYNQDIANLRLITDSKEVEAKLNSLKFKRN